MMKKNHLFCASTMFLGGALLIGRAMAQPATALSPKTIPPLTLAELEKLIGGRTTLTLNLKDATLEEAAAAINASSGLKLKVRPRPVFKLPPGMENAQIHTAKEPLFSFEAKGGPFWEEFLSWQKTASAARKAEPLQSEVVLPNGRTISTPRRPLTDLGLFQLQKFNQDTNLESGNPFPEGRSLARWPYVMIGTRLTRTQGASLDEEGLRTVEEANQGRMPFMVPRMAPAAPAPPKTPPTEEERWLDGLKFDTQIFLDPKIKPLNARCEVEEAIDDQGNDLRATGNLLSLLSGSGFGGFSFGGNGALPASIQLASKPKMGKKLVRLRGNLRFTVVTENQHWETTDLDTPTDGSIWRDGTQFAVKFGGLTKTPDGWEANFSARGEGQRLRQFWEIWRNEAFGPGRVGGLLGSGGIFGGPEFVVQFVDEAGQIINPTNWGGGATLNGNGGTKPIPVRPGDSPPPNLNNQVYTETAKRGIGRRMNADGTVNMTRPVKIIVDLPIERREVVVPFEFTNLPLPPS